MRFLLLILIVLSLNGAEESFEVNFHDYRVEHFVENLKQTIDHNEKARVTFASIYVIDRTKNINVDSIIKPLSESEGIVIEGISRNSKEMIKGCMVDYFLILQDEFQDDVVNTLFINIEF
jgi:hypothetical protein